MLIGSSDPINYYMAINTADTKNAVMMDEELTYHWGFDLQTTSSVELAMNSDESNLFYKWNEGGTQVVIVSVDSTSGGFIQKYTL